jgi:hypothetical protein
MKYIAHSIASTTCVALNRNRKFGLPVFSELLFFAARSRRVADVKRAG